jgi:regulatory protein
VSARGTEPRGRREPDVGRRLATGMSERASPEADAGDPLIRALEVSYRYLNPRERTEAEVRRHLSSRGFEPAAIDAALAVICDQGYLDDTRFARMFAEDKRELEASRARELLERRFRSPPIVARDRERALGVLLRKGFDSELALKAITAYTREAR